MAREQDREYDSEESLVSRRRWLQAMGVVAGTGGLSTASEMAAAQAAEPTIEVGSATVNRSWSTIPSTNAHTDPVVLAGPLSFNGPQPASTRLRNVTGTTFDLSVEEWGYLDGAHRAETVGYLATDTVRHSLADGAELAVGRTRTNHRWLSVPFSTPFATTPVVFSHVQSVNGAQPVVTRHRNVSSTGFAVRLQEEESRGPHRDEDVGYLVIEPGTGTMNGRPYEAGVHPGVDGTWREIRFSGTYDRPALLADVQTFRGGDTCSVRYRNLTRSSVEVKVEEERSRDFETTHVQERVGYLVVDTATDTSVTTGYGMSGYGSGGFGN